MHERSLVKALLRQVDELTAGHPASRVVKIRIRIGEFSGVEPELLASAYDDLVSDTPLRGAVLDWERVPLEAQCEQCGGRFRVEGFQFRCDQCGSWEISLRGGEEMLLDSVTMEETEP